MYHLIQVCIVGESGGDSASNSSKIIQWDTAISSGELGQHTRGRVMTCDLNHSRPFRCMTGGEDTNTLFSGNTPFVRIIVPAENNVATSKGHVREVNCVRFSPDSLWVCSVGGDKVMRLYHGKNGHCVYEQRTDTHDGAIYACAWSKDSRFLLTSSSDGTAKLWSLKGNPNDISSIGLECVQTWNVANHELAEQGLQPALASSVTSPSGRTSSNNVPKGGMQCGCAFVHNEQPVIVGINGHLTLLPKPSCLGGQSQEPWITLSGHQGIISTMAVHGKTAYTGDIDGVICKWDLESGNCSRILPCSTLDDPSIASPSQLLYQVHRGAISAIVALPTGVVMSVGWDDYLRFSRTNVDSSKAMQSTMHYKLKAQPNGMASGKSLVVISTLSGLVYTTTSTSTGLPAAIHPSPQQQRPAIEKTTFVDIDLSYNATCVAVASDDSLVAVGSDTGDLYFYKPSKKPISASTSKLKSSWTQVHVVEGAHFKEVSTLTFSQDNSMLASADVRDVCVWNVSDARNAVESTQHNNNVVPIIGKNRWCFHTQRITCLAWLSDTILASAGQDDQIYLWSLEKKMKRINYNYVHRGGVVGISFDPNRKVLVSAGKDGCICQWNVQADLKAKFGVTLP